MSRTNSRFTTMPTDRDANPGRVRRALRALFRPRPASGGEPRSGAVLQESAKAEMFNVQNSTGIS